MSKRYTAFMVRCWSWGEDELRIKVEHIQSGAGTQVDSLEAALAWMSGQWSARADGEALLLDAQPRADEPPED